MNRKALPIAIAIAATSIAAPIAHADTSAPAPVPAETQLRIIDLGTIDLGKIFFPKQADTSDQEWTLNVVPGQNNRASFMSSDFKGTYKNVNEIVPDLAASNIPTGWNIKVEDSKGEGIVVITPPATAKKGDKATYVINYKDSSGRQVVKGTTTFIASRDGVAPAAQTVTVAPGGTSEATLTGGNAYPTATKFSVNTGASNIPSGWNATVDGSKLKIAASKDAKKGQKYEVAIDLKDDAGNLIVTRKFNVEVDGDPVSPPSSSETSKPPTSNPAPPKPSKPSTPNPAPPNTAPNNPGTGNTSDGSNTGSPSSSDSAILIPAGRETILNIMDANKYPAAKGAVTAEISQKYSDIPNGWTVEFDKETGNLSVLPPNEIRQGDKNYAFIGISYKDAQGKESHLHGMTVQVDLGNGVRVNDSDEYEFSSKDGDNDDKDTPYSGSKKSSKKDKKDSDSNKVTPTVITPSGTASNRGAANGATQNGASGAQNGIYNAPGYTSNAGRIGTAPGMGAGAGVATGQVSGRADDATVGPEVKTGGEAEGTSFFAKVANLFR